MRGGACWLARAVEGSSHSLLHPSCRYPQDTEFSNSFENCPNFQTPVTGKSLILGRGGEIRTRDHLHPMQAFGNQEIPDNNVVFSLNWKILAGQLSSNDYP
jgi:hypothetical protein